MQKVVPIEQERSRRETAERLEEWLKKQSFLPEWLLADLRQEMAERYQRIQTPINDYGYDPFGFDQRTAEIPGVLFALIYRHWFRVETVGLENLPASGPVLIVANHAGNTFAWDASMIGSACFLEADPPRLVRGLGEYYLPTIPFFSEFMARVGSVVGTPENCKLLFEMGECVIVFPEGARGFVKPYSKAYQLQRFGLGFMRLALEHGVPILPVGVVGSEEQSPGITTSKTLAKLIGAPIVPITLTMPWLGPLGMIPLPAKYYLHFGPLMDFDGNHDADDAEIQKKVDQVKTEIDRLIHLGLDKRRGWFS